MEKIDTHALTQPFPDAAVKQRKGSQGQMFDYVEGHTVIHRLNAATGNVWDFEILALDWRDKLLMATVKLTIPGLGSRQHVGIQEAGQGGDIIKGAVTDALKKAATLFGVGLELYGPDYGAGEVDARQTPQQRPPTRSPDRPAARPQAAQAPPGDGEIKPCYQCSAPVRMGKADSGKPERYNADGSLHFKSCGKGPTGYESGAAATQANHTQPIEADPFADD